jgi:hypothetical protein
MRGIVSRTILPSWQVIGFTKLSGAAAATSIITIPQFDLLRITIIVTGYGGGDIVSLRFGGTAGAVDSGNNYATAQAEWNAGQSGNQSTNTENNTTNLMRLAASSVTTGRIIQVTISNNTTTRKVACITQATEYGAATVTPRRNTIGDGLWSNTTQPILSVQQLTAGGQNLNAGSGFVVEGISLS